MLAAEEYLNRIDELLKTNATVMANVSAYLQTLVSQQNYYKAIAEGDVAGHSPFMKIGFTPTMTTSESDVWSKAGQYVPPASAIQMSVVSSDNTATFLE